MKSLRWIIIGLVVAAVAGAGIIVTAQERRRAPGAPGAGGGPPPTPVLVASARHADVPVYLDGVGTVQAYNSVVVRAQIDGKLISINFREGQDVRRGDVIARIDPATWQAQLDQATAKLAQDQAQLANARIDLQRYQRLAQADYTTRQQADTQRAMVAQLEAQVRSDQAAIDNARAYLGYTTITAPIDGRVGIRLVDEGNVIHAGDANGIVSITQVRPISIIFSLPQQSLRDINQAMTRGRPEVIAVGNDNRTAVDRGELEVIDNQVDQTTGTIRLKATFPNADLQLWPGQFVNVRLRIRILQNAVVVPTAAVQMGPQGPFVYVVGEGDVVAVRRIVLGPQDDTQAVIAENVEQDERVVTTGFTRLIDGGRVSVAEAPAATPTAGPRGRGRPGGANAGGPNAGGANAASGAPASGGTGAPPQGARQRRGGDGAAQQAPAPQAAPPAAPPATPPAGPPAAAPAAPAATPPATTQ